MNYIIELLTAAFIGFIGGMVVTATLFTSTATSSKEECTINKPSGTTCVYEGGYVAKEVE